MGEFSGCGAIQAQRVRRCFVNPYFWRTYTGAELDYVEESGGQLAGFEFKYTQAIGKPPKTWLDTYPNATFTGINRDNYLDFVLL